jgi:hypothetical protein
MAPSGVLANPSDLVAESVNSLPCKAITSLAKAFPLQCRMQPAVRFFVLPEARQRQEVLLPEKRNSEKIFLQKTIWKVGRCQSQGLLQKGPVEAVSWVCFSSGCDMFMAGNMRDGIVLQDGCAQTGQRFILTVFEGLSFNPLKLYSDRVVVTVAPSAVTGGAGMPGAVVATDELLEFAMAPDKKVGRHLHPLDAFEVGVPVPVELVGEQALHIVTTILTRGKTDAMQNDQINHCAFCTRTVIG